MSSRRVLVVDDNPANVRLLEAVLATHGYDVVSARGGVEALTRIGECHPDLVVLDVQMPDMNGFEVCRRLRADEATAALPIVMVTAAGPEEKVAALEAGADDFVPRPFDQAELLARVRSLLRMKDYRDVVVGQAAELAAWNKTLEDQVRERVAEIDRLQGLRRFLSTRVAELVVAGGNEGLLEPHRRDVAVVCCDLRGFTAFSVAAEPEEVVAALKEFHEFAGALITRHGGTVGPFIGDSLIVIFNDPLPCPDPVLRAVTLAVELRDEMLTFEAAWRRRGHTLSAGIGVTYGFATLGVLGFAERSDYMAVGPVVNLANRLCDAAAAGEILVSQRVRTEVQEHVDVEDRGPRELRGFPEPQPVFALLGLRASAATVAAATGAAVEINVLGPLDVRTAAGEVEIRGARERALLLALAVNRGRAVTVDRLAHDLWDGETPESAVAVLRVQVSRLRKTLAASGLDGVLVTRPNGYLLDVADESLDVHRFEQLAAEGRAALAAGDATTARDRLRAALSLWRGEPYADVAGQAFADAEARRLDETRLVALEDCLEAELSCGHHRQVIGELETLVAAHPLRERLWAHWMVALHRAGRQPEALSAYQSLRTRLAAELGLDPSPDLARLHQAILTHADEVQPS